MNTLPALLQASEMPTLAAVQAALQGLSSRDQYTLTRTLGRQQQTRLYELCAEAEPVTRDDLIPSGVPPLQPVPHLGFNTLPLFFDAFRVFQKPMCGLPGFDEIGGYNEGRTRWLLGPGYFILRPTEPEHADRGAWVVDYFRVPEGEVAPGWPEIRPNSKGLQRFVYAGTRDYLRRVCDGVVIGAPYKGDKRLPFPFMLVRGDRELADE